MRLPHATRPTQIAVLMLPHPVSVAPDGDDVAMVQQPFDERVRYDLVAGRGFRILETLFEVSTVDARSWRALISWNKSKAPSWLTGR